MTIPKKIPLLFNPQLFPRPQNALQKTKQPLALPLHVFFPSILWYCLLSYSTSSTTWTCWFISRSTSSLLCWLDSWGAAENQLENHVSGLLPRDDDDDPDAADVWEDATVIVSANNLLGVDLRSPNRWESMEKKLLCNDLDFWARVAPSLIVSADGWEGVVVFGFLSGRGVSGLKELCLMSIALSCLGWLTSCFVCRTISGIWGRETLWKEYFFPISGQGGLRSGGLSKSRVPLGAWFNGCLDSWITPGARIVN